MNNIAFCWEKRTGTNRKNEPEQPSFLRRRIWRAAPWRCLAARSASEVRVLGVPLRFLLAGDHRIQADLADRGEDGFDMTLRQGGAAGEQILRGDDLPLNLRTVVALHAGQHAR
jgi:hypothetical protein